MAPTPSLEEVFLSVSDVSRSKQFYVGTLGFETEYEGNNFVLLRMDGGPTILLHDAEGEPVVPGSAILEIRVEDVDRWHREQSAGVGAGGQPPFEVTHEGDRWSPRREARLSDPDGYRIVLFTPKQRG